MWVAADWRSWGAVLATLIAVGELFFSPPAWDPAVMSSGAAIYLPEHRRVRRAAGSSPGWAERYRATWEPLFYAEGITSTVAVIRHRQAGVLVLRVNGKSDASTNPVDMTTQVLLGELPLLIRPMAREVLIIGLGAGITAGSVAHHPVRTITVVEIEPAVIEAARLFQEANGGVLNDPRLRVIMDDARTALGTAPASYDVMISEPSNPWVAGAAPLFTEEFYRLAAARLAADGLFCQWLPTYGMRIDQFRALLKTFASVFPQVRVFLAAPGDVILLGSQRPERLSLHAIGRAIGRRPVAEDLARVGVADPYDLLTRFLIGGRDVTAWTRSAVLLTDDRPRLEFEMPAALYLGLSREIIAALWTASARLWPTQLEMADLALSSGQVRTELARAYVRANASYQREGLGALGLAALMEATRLAPNRPEAYHEMGNLYDASGLATLAALAWEKTLRLNPRSWTTLMNLAGLFEKEGRVTEAAAVYEQALRRMPKDQHPLLVQRTLQKIETLRAGVPPP